MRTRQGALQRLLPRLLPQSRLRSAAGPPAPPKPVRGRAAAATPPAHAGRTDPDPDQGERGRPGEGGPRFGAGAARCGILALSLSFVSAPLVNYAVPLFPLVRSFPVARQRPDARVSATRRVPGASSARAGWRPSACARSSSYTRNEVHAAERRPGTLLSLGNANGLSPRLDFSSGPRWKDRLTSKYRQGPRGPCRAAPSAAAWRPGCSLGLPRSTRSHSSWPRRGPRWSTAQELSPALPL